MRPPVTAPNNVPVFSFAPCPVSGVALHAAKKAATSAAALPRTIDMIPPIPDAAGNARERSSGVPADEIRAQIRAKIEPVNHFNGLQRQTDPHSSFDPQRL